MVHETEEVHTSHLPLELPPDCTIQMFPISDVSQNVHIKKLSVSHNILFRDLQIFKSPPEDVKDSHTKQLLTDVGYIFYVFHLPFGQIDHYHSTKKLKNSIKAITIRIVDAMSLIGNYGRLSEYFPPQLICAMKRCFLKCIFDLIELFVCNSVLFISSDDCVPSSFGVEHEFSDILYSLQRISDEFISMCPQNILLTLPEYHPEVSLSAMLKLISKSVGRQLRLLMYHKISETEEEVLKVFDSYYVKVS